MSKAKFFILFSLIFSLAFFASCDKIEESDSPSSTPESTDMGELNDDSTSPTPSYDETSSEAETSTEQDNVNSPSPENQEDIDAMFNFIDNIDEDTSGIFNEDLIPDEETALEYAVFLFSLRMNKNPDGFKHQTAIYNQERDLWLVMFAVDEDTLGGDYTFVFSKKSGEVKMIQFGV